MTFEPLRETTFERHPHAHRIGSDAEAICVARDLAAEFATGAAALPRLKLMANRLA